MNNTFEWTRFCKVVRKDFNNMLHQNINLLSCVAAPAVLWLMTWMIDGFTQSPSSMPAEVRLAVIFGITCLTAFLAPGMLYKTINHPKEGIYFAMLPASKLEKYLSMLLYTIIICPLAVMCCSLVVDVVLTIFPFGPYKQFFWQLDYYSKYIIWMEFQQSDAVKMLPILGQPAVWMLFAGSALLLNTSIFVFGGTIFKRHKFLLTILWRWIISFVFELVATPFIGTMMMSNWEGLRNLIMENPARNFTIVVWGAIAMYLVLSGVLLWWSGHRLKKMTY